jgi:hypothetical protein
MNFVFPFEISMDSVLIYMILVVNRTFLFDLELS